MQNFTRIDFQFLNKGFDKKQLALIINLDYKYRIRSNKGILKNELCKMSGITPRVFLVQSKQSKLKQISNLIMIKRENKLIILCNLS